MMEYYKFNTFSFFRYYYHIPKSVKLRWCIIVEKAGNAKIAELRLGVYVNEWLYIDVAGRRFYNCIDCGLIVRKTYPARRTDEGENYCYRSESNGMFLVKPKTFISDLYRSSIYGTAKRLDLI